MSADRFFGPRNPKRDKKTSELNFTVTGTKAGLKLTAWV